MNEREHFEAFIDADENRVITCQCAGTKASWRIVWKACAESKQSELDTLRYVCSEAYQLAGYYNAPIKALDNLSAAANGEAIPHESFLPIDVQSELDAANARIAQLEDVLKEASTALYYGMANINNCNPKEGSKLDETSKHLELAYDSVENTLTLSSDTWLSQHDKAVERKVLEILAKKVDERGNPDRTLGDDILDMLKARK